MRKTITGAAIAAMLLSADVPTAAATAEQKCEAGMNDAAGKYGACAAKAEKGLVSTGDTIKYAAALGKCEGKLLASWTKLEAAAVNAGTVCPSTGDQVAIQNFVDTCVQSVAVAVGGGSLLSAGAPVLSSSQVICYNTAGAVIACAGTGQDGELQKGVARSFTDNPDGTIKDNTTGLVWEKLDDNNVGGIHDQDNTYTWTNAVTSKIATLNSTSFAGFTDWRLPNVRELQTLVDFSRFNPSTFPVFHTLCASGCTTATCSCTASTPYWTSTTARDSLTGAWYLGFGVGETNGNSKGATLRVRAVRGGS